MLLLLLFFVVSYLLDLCLEYSVYDCTVTNIFLMTHRSLIKILCYMLLLCAHLAKIERRLQFEDRAMLTTLTVYIFEKYTLNSRVICYFDRIYWNICQCNRRSISLFIQKKTVQRFGGLILFLLRKCSALLTI